MNSRCARAYLAGAALEQQVGEPDDGIQRGTQLVRHVGEKLALELGGPLQLLILGAERELVAPALRQHRGPVQSYHHLVAQNLQQLQVVLAEGLAVPAIVDAHRANHEAGGAERDDGAGLHRHRESLGCEAPRVGLHIIRDQRGVLSYRPPDQGAFHRYQHPHRLLHRAGRRFDLEEPSLFHHQGHRTPLRFEQLTRRLGYFLHQAVEIGAGKQGPGQVAQPFELAISPVGSGQRGAERRLLRLRQLAHVAEGDQGQQRGHRGEQQADPVVPADEPHPEPGDDDGDTGDGPGVGQSSPPALDAPGPAGSGGFFESTQALSEVRSS